METFLGLRSDTCFKERDTHRKTDRDKKGEIERKKIGQEVRGTRDKYLKL